MTAKQQAQKTKCTLTVSRLECQAWGHDGKAASAEDYVWIIGGYDWNANLGGMTAKQQAQKTMFILMVRRALQCACKYRVVMQAVFLPSHYWEVDELMF